MPSLQNVPRVHEHAAVVANDHRYLNVAAGELSKLVAIPERYVDHCVVDAREVEGRLNITGVTAVLESIEPHRREPNV